jgi:nucleoid DNA-binding protein
VWLRATDLLAEILAAAGSRRVLLRDAGNPVFCGKIDGSAQTPCRQTPGNAGKTGFGSRFRPFFPGFVRFSACFFAETVSNHLVHSIRTDGLSLLVTSHGGLGTMAKAVKKPPTKTQILTSIADSTGLTRKDVAAVFEALEKEIKKNVTRGAGAFTIPGLVKIEKKKVPARKAEKKVMFGEERLVAAKPASTKVKVRALKNLRDMVVK